MPFADGFYLDALLDRAASRVGLEGETISTHRGRVVLRDLEHASGSRPETGGVAVSLAVVGGTDRDLADATGGAILGLSSRSSSAQFNALAAT